MTEFFEGMSSLEKTYWITALLGSVIFIIIFIMTFIGGDMDSDMDVDGDFDVDDGGVGFQFFTFKNVVAFFTIFGWTGVTCLDNGLSTGVTLTIAVVAGLIMMVATSALFFWIHSLAESGTLKINNAVGQIGEVYLPIGKNRSKIGKISIKVQGSLRELEALTDEDKDLTTSTVVKVVEVISAELLLVKKLTK
jgi:hypothetical protein